MPMIDGHAHLNEIEDIDGVIVRAKAAGVGRVIAVGMETESNRATLELARRFPHMVLPAVGYHPWSITADGIDENLAFVRENLASCIALGEVGIDYKAKVKKPVQWDVYGRLLETALEADKPVIIHCRFSHARAFDMTIAAGIGRAVFHWYSGPEEILKKILDAGYFISTTPALAYSPPHRAAAAFSPLNRILVETDSPVEYGGRASEPADLVTTIHELAKIKNVPFEEAARITEENTRKFYGIVSSEKAPVKVGLE